MGVEVAFVDLDGWDHHANEVGQLSNLLNQFGNGLSAFTRDLGDRMADVVIVTMSEFGRAAAENGNGGTDHGHGGVMMVMGGPVKGGSVYGTWPGLEPISSSRGATSRSRRTTATCSPSWCAAIWDRTRSRYSRATRGAPLGLLKTA